MRTAADLEGALASLAAQADAYTAARDEALPRPVAEVELVQRPTRRRAAPITVGAALLAAAAVITLAVGVGRWTGRDDGSAPVGGTPAHREGPAPRTYRVTLDPKLGLRLLEINAADGATTADYYNRRTRVEVASIPASAHERLTPGLERVRLGAVGTGYYTDGTRPMFVEPPSDPATGGAGPTPTPPETRYAKAVVVQPTPGAFVTVLFQGSIPTKAQLMRIASGLRVRHTTARAIPSAVSLRSAPPGMRLVSIDSMMHGAGDNPPYALTGRDWYTDVRYQPAGRRSGIAIEATSVDLVSQPRKGGQTLTVAGRRACWFAKDHELDIDYGNGRFVALSGATEGASVAADITRADLIAVAETITVTAHPRQPGLWFPATRALP